MLLTIRETKKLERGLGLSRALYKYIRNSLFFSNKELSKKKTKSVIRKNKHDRINVLEKNNCLHKVFFSCGTYNVNCQKHSLETLKQNIHSFAGADQWFF